MTIKDFTYIPNDCPYTIRPLHKSPRTATYLIREHDIFGEYPNIFVKVYYDTSSTNLKDKPVVLILSDSGTGSAFDTSKSKPRPKAKTKTYDDHDHKDSTIQLRSQGSEKWNIATFLESTLNPSHAAPYIILTTHCHYDHICGIQYLQDAEADVSIRSSSHDRSYISPWENLQEHSLCASIGLTAPRYKIHWVGDGEKIKYPSGAGGDNRKELKNSSIIVFHTPGHTPDSVSWYDQETNVISVGDMFYERESDETKSGSNGRWKREPPMPVMFEGKSSIEDWSASMHRLLKFVRSENTRLEMEKSEGSNKILSRHYRQDGKGVGLEYDETTIEADEWELVTTFSPPSRVRLCAAHVTVILDAETALLDMILFMSRVQLGRVSKIKVDDPQGGDDTWLWDDCLSKQGVSRYETRTSCHYSVRAPWSVVHPKVG